MSKRVSNLQYCFIWKFFHDPKEILSHEKMHCSNNLNQAIWMKQTDKKNKKKKKKN